MLWLGNGAIDWDAVSAVGTLLASAIALLASWLALKAPEWNKQADRRESTHEVLRATAEAITLFNEAKALANVDTWPAKPVTSVRIRAAHLHEAMDRLISRPSLSDGAITIGAGAMTILVILSALKTTEELQEKFLIDGLSHNMLPDITELPAAKRTLGVTQEVVNIVQERMQRVKRYAKLTSAIEQD